MARNPNLVNKWKLGKSDAFGRGLSTDEDGNVVYDLLEVMGWRTDSLPFVSTVDYGKYGDVHIQDKDEETLEDIVLYHGSGGTTDYPTYWNIAAEFTMKSYIRHEVSYICDSYAGRSPSQIILQHGPVIKNYNGEGEDEPQEFIVVGAESSASFLRLESAS